MWLKNRCTSPHYIYILKGIAIYQVGHFRQHGNSFDQTVKKSECL